MSFVHPLLLGGLVLIGIPVLIHLIMQQKPKRLPFPAFRFLRLKHRTNQRKLRLRHLLLLVLRMLLIALLCLALARPKLFSERLNLGSDRPVAVAMVFDTSYSMEYTVGGKTRLEEAKRRALELLDELPEGSQVAVFDSAELGGEWAAAGARVREQIAGLRLRYDSGPVTRQLGQAYRLLDGLSAGDDPSGEPPPRFLYVFSDRAQECWDDNEARQLRQPEGVNAVFVDVGAEKPADLAVVNLELPRQRLGPGELLEVRATVQATGSDCDTFATCTLNSSTNLEAASAPDRKPVKLKAGENVVLNFDRRLNDKLLPGPYKVEVKLGTNDSLPFDNVRFATFEVRGGRKVLTVVDRPDDAATWKKAVDVYPGYQCEVRSTAEAAGLEAKQLLADYRVVVLFNVAAPDARLWSVLEDYVRKGGSLAIVPGEQVNREAYHENEAAKRLLPAAFENLLKVDEPGVPWADLGSHAFLAPFREWKKSDDVDFFRKESIPRAIRFWQVRKPAEDDPQASVIVAYAAKDDPPALVERIVGAGRVLQFTTGFDGRTSRGRPFWNTYLELNSSFYLALVVKAMAYLAGEGGEPNFNYVAGQTVPLVLPPASRFPIYRLQGPGLTASDAQLPRAEDQSELQVTRAVQPGNYTLLDAEGKPVTGFSLNVRTEECQLAPVSVDKIESLLGEKSVLPLGRAVRLKEALDRRWRQPVELFAYVMLGLLVVLALENLLANRFYRRTETPLESPPERPATSAE